MKIFKKLVLLGVICSLAMSPDLVVNATDSDGNIAAADNAAAEAAEEDVLVYDSISAIPEVLPDVSEIKFKPNHPAYASDNSRDKFLGQVVSLENDCLITFSVPEIAGLDNLDIEDYNFMAPDRQQKRILMVTVENYKAKQGDSLAESCIYIFNPQEKPEISLHLQASNGCTSTISTGVATIRIYSDEAITSKIWTDNYSKQSVKTNVYQSSGAGMDNYAKFGWGASGVDDATFSYDTVDLPLDMRKCLCEYLYDYNEYLSKTKDQQAWYRSLEDYWTSKEYNAFNLDQYAKSLGAIVLNSVSADGSKEYRIGKHMIRIEYYLSEIDWDYHDGHSAEIALDCSRVEWSEKGASSNEKSCHFDTHNFMQRHEEMLGAVKIDETHYVSRWDFNFIVSLLEYCSKT